jgi:hypothetical protein
LDQSLKIHREVESLRAQPPPRCADAPYRPIERNDFVDERIAFDERHPARPKQPAHAAAWKAVLQGGHRGQRVNHVTHGAEPDHKNAERVHI